MKPYPPFAGRGSRRLLGVGLIGVLLGHAAAAPAASPLLDNALTREALALCRAADAAPSEEQAALLTRGLERAETAVRKNPRDAAAHFAVFCNLGKRLKLNRRGFALLRALGEIDRARAALDTALALDPDYATALAAKGQMLIELPSVLGGDAREGKRLLRRAAAIDPDDPQIRVLVASLAAEDSLLPVVAQAAFHDDSAAPADE